MNWLRERREELGLNQEEFAAQLQVLGVDITRGSISNWETGKHAAPFDDREFRAALSRVLKLPVREILKRAGYEIAQTEHSDEGERAAYIVDELPEEKRDLAIRLLEQLIAS